MANLTIRLSDEDRKLFEKYADFEGKNLTNFVRDSVLEKIENEYDYQLAVEAYKEWEKDNFETTSHEKVMKDYDL